ncbi:MAG: hypothetical protein P1V36_00150 [Planctomycetota bacterium]|nr:hypothetical protein [Planctomycetota bacterium]
MAKLDALIKHHLRHYQTREKGDFDRARAYYRGDFWDASESKGQAVDLRLSRTHAQKNLVYAIADTGISNLLGPNPQVAAMPQTEESQALAGEVSALMTWAFRKVSMRRRSSLALLDATLCKRGVFKVTWDAKNDSPVISIPNPATVFFDLSVRDNDDISYWIQACPLRPSVYHARVKAGRYKHNDDIKPDKYPSWMRDEQTSDDSERLGEVDKRILVYEYYDCESGRVIHYHLETNHVLFEGKIDYIPFCMFSLNHSGVDCLGLSEVQLILDQQANINHLLTLWKRITYMQVPKILYDAGKIDSETLDKALDAAVGSFVGVDADGTDEMRNFAAHFYNMPLPEMPQTIITFIERLESDAAFQSALAEAARGQVAGAKTATEMAIIDAQLRTRLATREGHLNTAIEEVAHKMFYLMQRYMKRPKMVRLTGGGAFAALRVQDIKDLKMDFEMVAYNPIRKNPAVLLETLQAMVPLLMQAPNVDAYKLFEELIRALGLPNSIVIPEEKAREAAAAAAQAQAEAEQQQALGGAAVAQPEQEMPPQAEQGGPPPVAETYGADAV